MGSIYIIEATPDLDDVHISNKNSSMKMNSIWNTSIEHMILTFSPLKENIHADVVIIGGGITGLSTALLLIQKGFDVVLLESKSLCSSNTSMSSGSLSITTEKNLFEIENKYDSKMVKIILQARSEGLQQIENNIKKYSIDCDYQKVPWHLYSATKDLDDIIDQESQTLIEAGFIVGRGPLENIPYPVQSSVTLENQSQFHPMKYEMGLVHAICNQCRLYENSHVIGIQEEKDQTIIFTPQGKITTKYLVNASQPTKGMHALFGPYREYAIAFKVQNALHPKGQYYGLYDENNRILSRTYELDGETYIIIAGGTHREGFENPANKFRMLENFARTFFEFNEVEYKWSGQQFRPADLLPYIGRTHHETTFAATGFFSDGLLWGPVAAKIICDEMTNHQGPYAKSFAYNRFNPLKSVGTLIKENINILTSYLGHLPGKHEHDKTGDQHDRQ